MARVAQVLVASVRSRDELEREARRIQRYNRWRDEEKITADVKSPAYLEWLSGEPSLQHENIQRQVAEHPCVHRLSALWLAESGDPEVVEALLGNPKLDQAVIAEVVERCQRSRNWPELWEALAKSERTPVAVLERIWEEARRAGDFDCVRLLARNACLPEPMMRELSQRSDYEAVWMLAQNPSLPAELQRELAFHPSSDVRSGLAINPNLLPALGRLLASDEEKEVRAAATGNPAIRELLRKEAEAELGL